MAESTARPARNALAPLLLLLLAACGRPVGDLGSVGPSLYGSEAKPLTSKTAPALNPTDDERRMEDTVWRFEQAPYAKDWVLTKGYWPARGKVDAYFAWLSRQPVSSTQTRYRRLADHINSDLEMLPQTFDAICAVEAQDRRRDVAGQGVDGVEQGLRDQVAARQTQNRMDIQRFTDALAYRYDAFSYTLDHLLVATPQPEAVAIDASLAQLAQWLDRAHADDFCGPSWSPGKGGQAALPSRVLLDQEKQLPPK